MKNIGFWTGKKRPSLKDTNAAKTMFKKGSSPWNKGKKKIKVCSFCKKDFTTNQAKPHQKYCSLKCLGESKRGAKHPLWTGGRPSCKECNKILKWNREYCRNCYKKKNHHWWKGGITPVNLQIRSSKEYRIWREAVFIRDNWTCISCGENKSGGLQADHIKPFALFPELRFAIDNGRTLCVGCHKKTDSYLNNKIQREAYL